MKNNIIENWKAVPGYENYEVSDLGNVRSLNYKLSGKAKALKPALNRGYLRVMLYEKGEKRKYNSVHKLIYSSFKGLIPPGMTVDHINGIKTDNRLENLQLLSRGDNARKGNKGKKRSEETKAKMRASRTGKKRKPHTEETKAKLSAVNKGKKLSEETKAKMRAAHRARRELTI